jgi:hypothetical protein
VLVRPKHTDGRLDYVGSAKRCNLWSTEEESRTRSGPTAAGKVDISGVFAAVDSKSTYSGLENI